MTDDELKSLIELNRKEFEERVFFVKQNLGAEIHWFFDQGLVALKEHLYIPACSSFIIGIEASLRITQAQIEKRKSVNSLDPTKTLSNRLLVDARKNGLPVELLAFPNENDFESRLLSRRPNSVNVEIVRVRHDFCHGNILEYLNHDLGEGNIFFTPECLIELSHTLYQVSKKWCKGLGEFRTATFTKRE